MHTIFTILLIVALAVVLGVLLTGVFVFVRGGEVNDRWGNTLMRLRVATQLVAVIALGALILLKVT